MKKIIMSVLFLGIGTLLLAEQREQDTGCGSFIKGKLDIVEIGYMKGIGTDHLDCVALHVVQGYRFGPFFFLGLGTGCRFYPAVQAGKDTLFAIAAHKEDSLSPSFAVPFFVDCRVSFAEGRFFPVHIKAMPYLELRSGYAIMAIRERPKYIYVLSEQIQTEPYKRGLYEGGFFINPQVGVCYICRGGYILHTGIGYEMQRIQVHIRKLYISWYTHALKSKTLHSISFIAGITF